MDPIGVAFVGFGAALAAVYASEASDSIVFAALLAAAFWGAHRLVRARVTAGLPFVPLAAWAIARFWSVVPERLTSRFLAGHEVIRAAPRGVASLLLAASFAVVLVVGRARIGRALATLAVVAIAIDLLASAASLVPDRGTSAAVLFDAVASGWSAVSSGLLCASWLALAVGRLNVQPMERPGFAVVSAIAAMLLAATLRGAPDRAADAVSVVIFVTYAAALVVAAIAFGGLARVAGGAAWAAMALAIVQLLAIVPVVAILDRNALGGLGLATPFVLIGFGAVAIRARGLCLRGPRAAAAVFVSLAAAGALVAWLATWLSASRVLHLTDPFWTLGAVTRPAGYAGLVVWAAVIAYLAAPPLHASKSTPGVHS